MRRALKWTLRIVLALVGLVVVAAGIAVILLHTDWGRERARRIAVAQMNDTFVGGASIGKLEGSPFGELVVRDLTINGPDGKPAITAAEVHLHVALWPLVHHELRLDQVIVEQLDVDAGNLADLVKPGPPTAWTVSLLDTRIHHGHVHQDDNNFDDVLLDANAHIPADGTIAATLAVSATWREREAPIELVATVATDPGETVVPALVGRIGDVGVSALSARIVTKPAACIPAKPAAVLACVPGPTPPPQISGLVIAQATREAVAQLAPSVSLPADMALAVRISGQHDEPAPVAIDGTVGDKTGADATKDTLPVAAAFDSEQVIAVGTVGGSPLYAFVGGDLLTRHARGFVTATDLDLDKLAGKPGHGSAVVAFDVVPPTTGDNPVTAPPATHAAASAAKVVTQGTVVDTLPVATAMVAAWGDAMGHTGVVRAAIASDGARVHALGGATAPGLAAAIAAIVHVDGERITLEDARLVARAPSAAAAKLPIAGALHANLAAHGSLAPEVVLAVKGKADGEHLRYADATVASLQLMIDATGLPKHPTGSGRVVLAGVDRGDLHLETLSVAAADRPDRSIDVAVRTRPKGDPWELDADARVYPGDTTRIDLLRHRVRWNGEDWTGTTGRVEIGPRGYSIAGFASTSQRGSLALDADYRKTGHLAVDIRADGGAVGKGRVALDLDAPTQIGNAAAWARLRRSAIHSADVTVDAHLDKLAEQLGMTGITGTLAVDLHATPRDAHGTITLAGLHAPALREVGAVSATVELADDGGQASLHANARVDGIGGIHLLAKARVPDHPFDVRAYDRSRFDGASLTVDEIALEPALFDQLHVTTAFRGRLGLSATVEPGARALHVAADIHQLRGGVLVTPIDIHADTSIDGSGTTASASVSAAKATLLAIDAKLPITPADLLANRFDRPLTGTITLPSAPVARLLATVGRTDLVGGTVDGTVAFAGTIGKPTLTAKLAAHDLVTQQKVGLQLMTIDASWDGTAGKVAIAGREQGGGKLELTATGSSLATLTAKVAASKFDLRPLTVFAPGPAGAVTGQLDADLAIASLDPPDLTGTLAIHDGRIPIAPSVGTLRQASIDVKIAQREATIAVDATLGKGKITVRGRAPLTGAQGIATITLRKVRPIGAVEPTIDADIDAAIQRANGRWEATVKVSNGVIAVPDDKGHPLDPVGPPEDFAYGVPEAPPPKKQKRSEPEHLPPPIRPFLVCKVDIGTTRIQSKEVRGLIDGQLRISVGPGGAGIAPIGIVGDIQAERGDLDLFDRRYQLDHAVAHFDGSLDPELDASIQYDFPDVTTITEVRGRLSKPELVLRSEPGIYSQGELLGFLLGGEPYGDPNQSQSATQKAEGAGESLVANKLGGYVKDALPLDIDVLRYEAATSANSSAITVGTWLTHELFLAYRQHLEARPDENAGEGQVEYWLAKRLSLQATAGDRGYDGIDLLWRKRW